MAKADKGPGQTGVGRQVEVEFLRSVQYECDGRKQGPKYFKGQRYTFDEAFADRWIKRNAAYDVNGDRPLPQEEIDGELPGLRGGASGGGL